MYAGEERKEKRDDTWRRGTGLKLGRLIRQSDLRHLEDRHCRQCALHACGAETGVKEVTGEEIKVETGYVTQRGHDYPCKDMGCFYLSRQEGNMTGPLVRTDYTGEGVEARHQFRGY